jgi:hypothetical protein
MLEPHSTALGSTPEVSGNESQLNNYVMTFELSQKGGTSEPGLSKYAYCYIAHVKWTQTCLTAIYN